MQVLAATLDDADANALRAAMDKLKDKLRSAVIVPLGHRQVDGDWLVKLPKVRRPLEQFVSELR